MDVPVNVFVRDCHKHDDNWIRARGENVPIRVADRVQDDLVANHTPINEGERRLPVVCKNLLPRLDLVYFITGAAEAFLMLDKLVHQTPSEYLKEPVTEARC